MNDEFVSCYGTLGQIIGIDLNLIVTGHIRNTPQVFIKLLRGLLHLLREIERESEGLSRGC